MQVLQKLIQADDRQRRRLAQPPPFQLCAFFFTLSVVEGIFRWYNTPMKIVIFESDPSEEGYLKESLTGLDLAFVAEKLTLETAGQAAGADVVSIFTGSHIDAALLDAITGTKLIVTRTTGYDHVDLVAAKAKGVQVTNVPGYGSVAVAEHAFALLLAISRRIFDAARQVREEGEFHVTAMQGFDLFAKKIGVLGTGRIGKNAARIAKGFGMQIMLFDAHPDGAFTQEIGARYYSLDDVLATADILTLHLPALPETMHIINADAFAKMKRGMVIINTARGSLIDTEALLAAIQDGVVSHVGLDVLEDETELSDESELVMGGKKINDWKALVMDHILIERPEVLITPHIAFHTVEADRERLGVVVSCIQSFTKGEPLKNVL